MDKVDRKRKVGDELGSNNKDEYEDDAEEKLGPNLGRVVNREDRSAASYLIKLFNNHTSANIQPTVVSGRMVRQLRTRSSFSSFPATSTVKTIRTAAHV
jgi:hypothetical protein